MAYLRLLFMALLGICFGFAGCAEEALPGPNSELCEDEFQPSLLCLAFCETAVAECQLFQTPTVEECVQVCECQLARAGAVSDQCKTALTSEFACAAALDCPDFTDLITRLPPSSFPCREEALGKDAQCAAP